MVLSLVTAPTAEPLLLSEVKAFARVDGQADDAVLDALISMARLTFEGKDAWFGRALMTQTWDLFLPRFPCGPDDPTLDGLIGIRVPLPPLQSVTSVKYLDTAGVEQTVSASDYVLDTKSEPGRIVPAYGKTWPSTRETVNPVAVRFVAGYGANASAVPKDIREWLKATVAFLFENREAPVLPEAFFWSLASYKVAWRF